MNERAASDKGQNAVFQVVMKVADNQIIFLLNCIYFIQTNLVENFISVTFSYAPSIL